MFAHRCVLSIIVLVLLFPSCNKESESSTGRLPFFSDSDFTPYWLDPKLPMDKSFHRVQGLSFANQHDEIIDDSAVRGKIFVAGFFDLDCKTFCQVINENLQKVQSAFAEDSKVLLLSHSIGPYRNTEALTQYAEKFKAIEGKWHYLQGSKAKMSRIKKTAYLADERMLLIEQPHREQHPERVLLIDPSGHIRGVYSGTIAGDVQRIIDDIRILKKEYENVRYE